jgi:EF-P beta-lysylation protein EpmB
VTVSWHKILAQGFASAGALLDFLGLPVELASKGAEQQFSTRVPISFAQRMQRENPYDPLLLQVLAHGDELIDVAGYSKDPLLEVSFNPVPGLVHKYHGRVLLILTGACAINCRYCFRRHFPYQVNNPGRQGWGKVIEYIQADSTIEEVILSGGDPLLMSDSMLAELLVKISSISHIKTVRIHTRVPIVLPERINKNFLSILTSIPQHKVIVLHCNHSQEIDNAVLQSCLAMHDAGCNLLNQSVLLRKVNDNADVLAKLSKQLFTCKVLPYYLHLLDRVTGSAHFNVPILEALDIYHQLQAILPGYLVPRLAQELPNVAHKTLIV